MSEIKKEENSEYLLINQDNATIIGERNTQARNFQLFRLSSTSTLIISFINVSSC